MTDDLAVLRKLHSGYVTETELLDILHSKQNNHRILFHLVQHPRFPEKHAIDIITHLYAIDLVKVIKNKRTRPFVRKRAELEFLNRYHKLPLGEKISYMKIAPNSLLTYFLEEKEKRILLAILTNPTCTEDTVLRFVNRETSRAPFYDALLSTEWYKRPIVAEAILFDSEAPIRLILAIIPLLSSIKLKRLLKQKSIHEIVRKNIELRLSDMESPEM